MHATGCFVSSFPSDVLGRKVVCLFEKEKEKGRKGSEAGVYYVNGMRMPFACVWFKTKSIAPRKTAISPASLSTSELRRRLFTTLDSRLEIPVEFRKVPLRLLVPAEGRAHQKGQHAREVFRLGQGRRSRVRLARFEAERVLADEETV